MLDSALCHVNAGQLCMQPLPLELLLYHLNCNHCHSGAKRYRGARVQLGGDAHKQHLGRKVLG